MKFKFLKVKVLSQLTVSYRKAGLMVAKELQLDLRVLPLCSPSPFLSFASTKVGSKLLAAGLVPQVHRVSSRGL